MEQDSENFARANIELSGTYSFAYNLAPQCSSSIKLTQKNSTCKLKMLRKCLRNPAEISY